MYQLMCNLHHTPSMPTSEHWFSTVHASQVIKMQTFSCNHTVKLVCKAKILALSCQSCHASAQGLSSKVIYTVLHLNMEHNLMCPYDALSLALLCYLVQTNLACTGRWGSR